MPWRIAGQQLVPQLAGVARADQASPHADVRVSPSQQTFQVGQLLIAALLLGGFSRFGLWRQMGVSVLLLIVVQMIHTWASGASLRSDTSWPLVYVAPVVGVGIAALLLWLSQRPRRLSRQTPGAAT